MKRRNGLHGRGELARALAPLLRAAKAHGGEPPQVRALGDDPAELVDVEVATVGLFDSAQADIDQSTQSTSLYLMLLFLFSSRACMRSFEAGATSPSAGMRGAEPSRLESVGLQSDSLYCNWSSRSFLLSMVQGSDC